MKKIYLLITISGLTSCKDFSEDAKKELLQNLKGSWQTIFKTNYNAKYNRLNFLNDSIVICHSGNKIDTLSYELGISSINLIYPDGNTSYFYVTKINEESLTLREDVSDTFKAETSIYYERSAVSVQKKAN